MTAVRHFKPVGNYNKTLEYSDMDKIQHFLQKDVGFGRDNEAPPLPFSPAACGKPGTREYIGAVGHEETKSFTKHVRANRYERLRFSLLGQSKKSGFVHRAHD